jgi:Icc-related predicted phosphoesterase
LRKQPTRIFYASDVHGSERCFVKFLNAARFYGAQVLILGGDITGKVVVPLIARPEGGWEATFLGSRREAHSEAEAQDIEKAIRFNGFYPVRVSPGEWASLESDPEQRQAAFAQVVRSSLERWLALAEEKLRGTGVRCFINPGNDDEWVVDEVLPRDGAIRNPDGRVVPLDEDHEMLTVGFSNRTPFDSPREMEEAQLEAHLRSLAAGLSRPASAVFTVHVPPFGSGLDSAPALRDMRVVTRGGHTVMEPVGSRAVRAVLEEVQPLLALHGHVHESRGVKRLGRTLCVNPGSEYGEGILHGAVIALGPDRVAGYQLVAA